MSSGDRIPLAEANLLADRILATLAGTVVRAVVAGSVRRRLDTVGDIEVVAEPYLVTRDLFGGFSEVDVDSIRGRCAEMGQVVAGGRRQLKVEDVFGSGVQLDLYLVHPPADWGPILAIRTGPASYSEWCVTRLKRRGTPCRNGRIVSESTGEHIPAPTEQDFFRRAGLKTKFPWERGV